MKEIILRNQLCMYPVEDDHKEFENEIYQSIISTINSLESYEDKLNCLHLTIKDKFLKNIINVKEIADSPLIRFSNDWIDRIYLPRLSEILSKRNENNSFIPYTQNDLTDLFSKKAYDLYYKSDLIADSLFELSTFLNHDKFTTFKVSTASDDDFKKIVDIRTFYNTLRKNIEIGKLNLKVNFPCSLITPKQNKNSKYSIKISNVAVKLQNHIFSAYAYTPWYSKDTSLKKETLRYSYDKIINLLANEEKLTFEDHYILRKISGLDCTLFLFSNINKIPFDKEQKYFIYNICSILPNLTNIYGRSLLIKDIMRYYSYDAPGIPTNALIQIVETLKYYAENNPYKFIKETFWNLLMRIFFPDTNNVQKVLAELIEVLEKEVTIPEYERPYDININSYSADDYTKDSNVILFSILQSEIIKSILEKEPYQEFDKSIEISFKDWLSRYKETDSLVSLYSYIYSGVSETQYPVPIDEDTPILDTEALIALFKRQE